MSQPYMPISYPCSSTACKDATQPFRPCGTVDLHDVRHQLLVCEACKTVFKNEVRTDWLEELSIEEGALLEAERLGRFKDTCRLCHGNGRYVKRGGRATQPEVMDPCPSCKGYGYCYFHGPSRRGNCDDVLRLWNQFKQHIVSP